MKTTVQARLDEETQATLDRLRLSGLRTSEVIRKGIHLVAKEAESARPIKIIGLGKYDFGVTDLSTNKKYMAGFGRSSMPGGKPKRKPKGR
jgi:hypothetical protein